MKKMRILAAFLVLALVMTGCCLKHEWVEADCVTPKTCAKCEKTEGEPLGHDWKAADCVNPKTCADCGETEGAALGHTWVDATCTAPKTCSVCSATEGEALAHAADKWTVNGSNMTATCINCSAAMEEALDWEVIGWQEIVDRWEISAMTTGGDWEFVTYEDIWVEFNADGTATFCLFDPIEGTAEYVGYEEDADDIVFRIYDGEGDSYTFKLWYKNDTLFIFGSGLSFAFERA